MQACEIHYEVEDGTHCMCGELWPCARPTDDDIVAAFRAMKPCSHGTRFWCEDCVTDAFVLHTAISKAETLAAVAAQVQAAAGQAWIEDKYPLCDALKALAKDFAAQAKTADAEADKIRKAQRKKSLRG